MNSTNKKHSILFRGLILVVAFALSILCFPINNLVALAADGDDAVNYHFLTIDKMGDEASRIVKKGGSYTIPQGYIGGSKAFEIGKTPTSTTLDSSKNVEYVSSGVKVTYNGTAVDVDEKGKFVAANEGTYVVTYSYTYTIDGKEYINSYDMQVQSVLSSASINFSNNGKIVMPSILDLSVAGAKDKDGNYKNLYIPLPEVKDEKGETIKEEKNAAGEIVKAGVKYVTSLPADATGNYVVITANGSDSVANVVVKQDENDEFYISGEYFKAEKDTEFEGYGAGNYTVKFAYYVDGNFVTSTTKTTQVYAEDEGYYKNYKLSLELASDWVDNGQTGVERTLPAAVGATTGDSTPSNEKVDVAYKVEVRFTSNKSESGYKELTAEQVAEYNKDSKERDGEDIFVEEKDEQNNHKAYYLADPSKFKPLEDGSYTFIYTITDFYGNSISSSVGAYEWLNIKDEQKPTPVIYDAAVKDDKGIVTFENADYKLASQTAANGVVVYAIGMEDNVSKVGDEKVELSRKVMTSETVSKFTISGYNSYNLIFNYRQTQTTVGANGEGSAWSNLQTNDYYIRKLAEKHDAAYAENAEERIDSDAEMLDLLKKNGYLIVVDNANADHIYNLFKDSQIFDSSITSGETLKTWLKAQKEEATISELGFAYVDVDQTFGATSSNNGMGSGYYYIHYIAKDAAGNETDVSRRMQIGVEYDNEKPTIRFSTTLQTAYTPSSIIKFDVPTATDTQDSYMKVHTLYRYLDVNGKVVEVENKSTNNLKELREDLDANNAMEGGVLLTKIYDEYLKDDANGYIALTDTNASSYSIDLSEVEGKASKLQIIVYVYDDYGNANIHAQTVDIANANDKYAPKLVEDSIKVDSEKTYEQGAEIKLPTMVVRDDSVAYMSFDVNVKYIADKDSSINITPYGYYAERKVLSLDGTGELRVNAGSFLASWAGDYQVSISVRDGAGNTVVSFMNYTVAPRIIVQAPQINTSLPKTQTIELDDYALNDTIEIAAPTVSYEIPRSVTYDVFKGNDIYTDKTSDEYTNTDFVVYGVDKDGKPLNYSTTFGQAGSLKPRELGVGEYDLSYSVDLLVYNYKLYSYKEMSFNGTDYEGGYLTYSKNNEFKIVAEKDRISISKNNQEFILSRDSEGKIVVYLANDPTEVFGIDDAKASPISTLPLANLFNDIQLISMTSENYNITIKDTKGPKIANYDYISAISKEDLTKLGALTIQGIQATDASGIDMDKSYVTLSWKLANGSSSSRELKNSDFKNGVYNHQMTNVVDGTYRITYTVYDNAGNYTTSNTYEIAVGDNIAPTMTFVDDFVKTNYEIGTELEIDLSSITLSDKGSGIPEGTIPTVVLKNTSTGKEVEAKEGLSDTIKKYALDEVGTYTLTFTVEDAAGNKTTKDITFEVSTKTQDSTSVYKVVGTVLIVVSVLVLAGVIVYFIVSKVKLDKELKK